MKALVYKRLRDVVINTVANARIEKPPDVPVKITNTKICGSALHMVETSVEKGNIRGHENLCIAVRKGSVVECMKPGDRLCLSFNFRREAA